MLSFVVVPFTNGSPMGMGKMTTFFHPYTSPLSIFFFFWIDISPFFKTLSCSCSTGIERGAMQMRCTAPVRRALSNHIIFIAPGFILFPKVGLIRRTGFCWINPTGRKLQELRLEPRPNILPLSRQNLDWGTRLFHCRVLADVFKINK